MNSWYIVVYYYGNIAPYKYHIKTTAPSSTLLSDCFKIARSSNISKVTIEDGLGVVYHSVESVS